ncbi:MAG: spinster family MFS transporter [Terriglobales bacterium]
MRDRVHPRAALAVLTALNFLNYIDRSILFAVQPLVQTEFGASDAQMGMLTTSFFICYGLTAPVLGYIADRHARRPIIVGGALVWSAATLLTALTWDYRSLLVRHAIVGLGEASFVATTPSYLADLFPQAKRGRAMSVFFMAIPAGTAMGYLIGGYFGFTHGWRMPFYIVAAPGVVLALAVLAMREPMRGALDTIRETVERGTIRGLARNPAYWTATLGLAMTTFALGGLQVWMPTFLTRLRGMTLLHANLFFAVITAINGVVATLTGGWIADRLLRRRHDAYYFLSGLTMAVSVPVMLAAIMITGPAMYPMIFVAEFCLLLNTGPLNAALVDSVGASIRALAMAINLIVVHALGDALSATLIGYVSDRTHSLLSGFMTAVVAVVLSAAILLYGKRYAPRANQASLPQETGATA